MYLHIGQDVDILTERIIGIYDLEVAGNLLDNKLFKQITVSDDLPTSVIVYQDNNEVILYLSSITSTTLFKRLEGDSLFL